MKLVTAITLITITFSTAVFAQNNIQQSVKTVTAICNNEDFESAAAGPISTSNQVPGWWSVDAGLNQLPNNSCNLNGCCPYTTSASAIVTIASTGYIDPMIGSQYPIYSIFGSASNNGNSVNPQYVFPMLGNTVLRLNDTASNHSMEKITKTYSLSSSNYKFQFAYISVFSPTHSCCDATAFKVYLTDATTNSVIAFGSGSYSVSASSNCTGSTNVQYYVSGSNIPSNGSNGSLVYNKWQVVTFDLSAYIPHVMQVEFIATDCAFGDHFGYVYLDAQCGAADLGIVNNEQYKSENIKAIPNPFKSGTEIEYYRERSGSCICKIQDITGRVIYEEELTYKVGKNNFAWNGTDKYGNKCSAGVYIVTLRSQELQSTLKLIKE